MRTAGKLNGVLLKYPLFSQSLSNILSPLLNLCRRSRVNAQGYEDFLYSNEANILKQNEMINLASIQHNHDC